MSKAPHFHLSVVRPSFQLCLFFSAVLAGCVICPWSITLAEVEFASEEEPIDIHADRIEYSRTDDTYIADGNVDVVRGTQHLTSDHATLNMKAGLLLAEGTVTYDNGEQTMTADRMELSIKSKAGVIFHPVGSVLVPWSIALAVFEVATEEEPIDIHADRVEYLRTCSGVGD